VNGALGIVVAPCGHLLLALTLMIKNGRIADYEVITDPPE